VALAVLMLASASAFVLAANGWLPLTLLVSRLIVSVAAVLAAAVISRHLSAPLAAAPATVRS